MSWPIYFLKPADLYFLLPVSLWIIAGFLLKRHWSRGFDEFFRGEGLQVSHLSWKNAWLKGGLLACAFVIMVLASADPAARGVFRSPNVLALVDISQSMWCADYREQGLPKSRLEIARDNVQSLLEGLPAESRLGLGVFAGTYESVLMLTPPRKVGENYGDLKSMIRSINNSWTWDDGTNIPQSLSDFGRLLEKNRESYGKALTVILLTDGENFPPSLSAPEPNQDRFPGVNFYFAGHGTTQGAPVPEFDDHWNFHGYRQGLSGPLMSRMDEEYMKKLAKVLHGSYRHMESGMDLKSLARSHELKNGEYLAEVHLGWAFWLGSFVLLCLFLIV